MGETRTDSTSDILPAERGVGPLLQRDYRAVIASARMPPSQVVERVRRHFASFALAELAAFRAHCGEGGLEVEDELDIEIAGAGHCRVRLVHRDAQSLTLATLQGHPEAGRITFGAYRNRAGDVVFHIRSRARSDSLLRLLGFLVAGEAMQTNTWTQFTSRVAALAGSGVAGPVHAGMQPIDEDQDALAPTFLARGG